MAKHGSVDVTIEYDDGPGGAPVPLTNFVMELGGAKIEVKLQTSHAFGDAWEEHTPTGMRAAPAIKCSGQFDTATGGPHATLCPKDADASPNAQTRTLKIGFGDGVTFTVETRLMDYEVAAKNGALTDFNATIQPTGAAVWAP